MHFGCLAGYGDMPLISGFSFDVKSLPRNVNRVLGFETLRSCGCCYLACFTMKKLDKQVLIQFEVPDFNGVCVYVFLCGKGG